MPESPFERAIYYSKERSGVISQNNFWRHIAKSARKVSKGALILIDEFEKQGGCEDDLWV